MRTLVVLGVVVCVVLLIVVPGAWRHLKQLPEQIGGTINENVSDGVVVREAEEDIGKGNQVLFNLFCGIRGYETQMAKASQEKADYERKLKREETILKASKVLLTKHQQGEKFRIGGKDYTWEQLNEESLERVLTCEGLRKLMASSEQSLSKYTAARDATKEKLAKKQQELRQAKIQFNMDKIELEVAAKQKEIDAMVGKNFSGEMSFSGLNAVHERAEKSRAWTEFNNLSEPKGSDSLAWDKELGVVPDKASDAIQSYFKTGKK